MTADLVQFEVVGVPRAQGSKRAFSVNGRAVVAESNPLGHAAWRKAVADRALAVAEKVGILEGPLTLTVTFRFAMPKSKSKSQRSSGVIPKASAPDLDKLLRCLGDGLQAAGLVRDDAQFASISATKVEVADGWVGAAITLASATVESPGGAA